MKTILPYLSVLALATMSGLAQGTTAQSGNAKAPPPPPPRSVFTQPTNSHEGRDPFWPDSNRIFDSTVSVTQHAVEPTTLKIDGYSIVNGRPIIILNKVSFLAGDEADLPSAAGGHTHVRCVEIHADYVVVEVNGLRREIHF